MKMETKYSLGDTVFGIRDMEARRKRSCPTCDRKGTVRIGVEEFTCPKCFGTSMSDEYSGRKSFVDETGRVGNVRFETTEECHCREGEPATVIQYMLNTTGVGSGQLWKEADLWPTREDAQAECDRRNASLAADET